MKNIVIFSQALADETRWRILQLIFDEPMCVCELADILEMPQSSVSSHIQVIKRAGILDHERCGKWIYYRVTQAYRHFFLKMYEFFEVSPALDPLFQKDSRKAQERMALRDQSCCPLPSSLQKLTPLTPVFPSS